MLTSTTEDLPALCCPQTTMVGNSKDTSAPAGVTCQHICQRCLQQIRRKLKLLSFTLHVRACQADLWLVAR
jgi:hypothetical protein